MSELKVHKAYNRWLDEEMPTPNDDLICNEVYLKSEADKFIADLEESHKKEVGQLLMEIAELKNRIAPKQSDKTLQERLNEVCEKHGVSTLQDLDWAFCESEKRNTKYCIEAYKVIAEQKSEIERLEILCADYRHDCDNLAISNEQVKRAASTLLKKMNHNKYKRCLAMAEMCDARHDEEDTKVNGHGASWEYKSKEMKYWERWHNRWLAIAEKFKPN